MARRRKNTSNRATQGPPVDRESVASAPQAGAPPGWAGWLVCGLLLVAVLLVFGQTVQHEFVNFDDDQYVTQNPHVTGAAKDDGITWAFTQNHAGNWHPLTWLSHMLDCRMYGLWAGGHHLTNVLLHAATAILLFLVLRQMTGAFWPSAWAAAVFAIHPLRAESVAWVAERKDVLSGLFFMLTLGAYAHYARRPFSLVRYLAVVLLFALGLMSKPMLVTLPFVLILLDAWPLRRIDAARADRKAAWRLVLEKIPLLALSAASCMVTLTAQNVAIHEFPLHVRIANALVSYVGYLGQLFWPVRLAVYYPYPDGSALAWEAAGAALLLLVISVVAVIWRRTHPWLLVGWLWYLGMMVPVIGLIQVGGQAMADRYTYLTQIGPVIALAWIAAAVWRDSPARRWKLGLGVATVLVLMTLAWRQTATWRNNETLWRHAVASTSRNFRAHNYLGITLSGQKRLDEAIEQFQEALAIQPENTDANGNIGIALVQKGRVDEAIVHYRRGLETSPDCAEIHNNLGNALMRKGQVDEAIVHYQQALVTPSDRPELYLNLGNALIGKGRADEAIVCYQKALATPTVIPEVYFNLGVALGRQGRLDEAIASIRTGLELRPNDAEAYRFLGLALWQQGKHDEAIAMSEHSLALATAQGNTQSADLARAQIQAYRAQRTGR